MVGQRASSATERAGNPELVRAQEYLADLGNRLAIDGSTGEPTSQRIFDAGLLGLDFFRVFGPSYADLKDKRFSFETDILARYNAQREISFAKLQADAGRFAQVSSAMTETDLDYRNSASSLFDYWQGDAADQAKSRISGFLSSAGSVWARIDGLGGVLRAACRAAERIAFEKASAVLGIAAQTVGGLTGDDVATLVEAATVSNSAALTNDQLADLAELAELSINPAVCRTNAGVLNMVADGAQDWLDQAFAPVYEARLAVFEAACDRAQANLDLVWGRVTSALGELSAQSAGAFDDEQQPAPVTGPTTQQAAQLTTPAGQPTTTNAPAVTPASTPAAPPADPTTSTPATVTPTAAAPPVAASVPPAHQGDSVGGIRGGSIASRLAPTEDTGGPGTVVGGGQTGGVGGGDAGPMQVGGLDMGSSAGVDTGQHNQDGTQAPADQGQHAEQPAQQAAAPTTFGGGGFMPPRMAPGGGEGGEHKRKVPVKGNPVPTEARLAAPSGVLGGADDPAAYNEAQQFDDDSRAPRQMDATGPEPEPEPILEEKKQEPMETVWRLTEDGEIESVMVPKKPKQ